MTTTFDIERRLRIPAADEPAVLPPLRFLAEGSTTRSRPPVRFRVPATQLRGVRLIYAIVALLLLAGVVAVGALRLLENRNPLANLCDPLSPASPGEPVGCWTVEVPEGWHELSSVSLFPGDFTEVASGIAYERVDRILATADLGDCQGPGPLPTGIPIGTNAFEVPRETQDVGLLCWRTASLPDNAIRVEILRGSRVSGLEAPDGPAIPDTSEPTRAAGWTEEVGGRPARLIVTSGTGAPGAPAETRTWDVLLPGAIDQLIRIKADIAGPDLAAGRNSVQALIDSFEFAATLPSIDESQKTEVLRATLDDLERTARESHSDLYGCFPREGGERTATISGGLYGPLSGPTEVRCSSAITASRADLWRIRLELAWDAGDGYPADTIRIEFFALGPDEPPSGGYPQSLAGRTSPTGSVDDLFPNGTQVLPPPLAGPLNIPAGSVAQLLAPGTLPLGDLDMAEENAIVPSVVGLHLYVVRGPELIDSDEWYRVQWEGTANFSGESGRLAWVQGTKDGRPLLAVVEPDCPAGPANVEDLTWLIPAERFVCFGDRELTVERATIEAGDHFPQVPDLCSTSDGQASPCPSSPGQPDWLTAATGWWLYGPGGREGPSPGLPVWITPSIVPTPGAAIRVTGHFDDPGAVGCVWGEIGSSGFVEPDPAFQELLCRERFVITSFELAEGH